MYYNKCVHVFVKISIILIICCFFFRYLGGFLIFYVLGTCLLLPWYFFMTANDVSFKYDLI